MHRRAAIAMSADRKFWIPDDRTWKIAGYHLEGHPLYAWGSQGEWPGGMWNAHRINVVPDGNL